MSLSGMIFDIQGFSLHDGPGCRTLVFLSGCPMRCAWCANPEGQLLRRRLMYQEERCHPEHYHCVKACPHMAIHIYPIDSPSLTFDRSLCDRCEGMECVKACLHEALKIAGRIYTVDELMRILNRDQGFWGEQGGVTFSGGEPLSQPEFISAVLERCRSSYIHTAVETCAHVDTRLLLEILQWTDWLFIDLKHIDSAAHKAATGVGNELVLNNITTVAASGWDGRLVIRVPIVPGFNDTVENFQAIAEFVKMLNLKEVNLLPFHRLGSSKYQQLGLDYPYSHISPPSKETMQTAHRIFTAAELSCYVDFETPF
jgi:pyruvate formate lyase activating enzyme